MKLYSGPVSLFSRKIEIALAEKGLPFERELVPFNQSVGYSPKHPAVLAANPKGQVPVLIDGDLALFDSTVILEYLEDAYPTPPLYPADAKERARCRLVELYADEILLVPIRALMYRTEPPSSDRERQASRTAEARRAEAVILEHYGKLEGQLAGRDYFCGRFSVADIGMFMTVLFAQRLNGPRLGSHSALAGWYARVWERPSVLRVVDEIAAADSVLSPTLQA